MSERAGLQGDEETARRVMPSMLSIDSILMLEILKSTFEQSGDKLPTSSNQQCESLTCSVTNRINAVAVLQKCYVASSL